MSLQSPIGSQKGRKAAVRAYLGMAERTMTTTNRLKSADGRRVIIHQARALLGPRDIVLKLESVLFELSAADAEDPEQVMLHAHSARTGKPIPHSLRPQHLADFEPFPSEQLD